MYENLEYDTLNLKDYLTSTGIQKKAFARMVGISLAALSNYIHGRRIPRLDIAHRIVTVTKGKVTIKDLLK